MREKLHRTKWAPDRAKHQGKDWPSFLTGMVLSSTHPALPSPTTVAWRLNSRAWTSATVARNLVAIDWDQPSALSSHRGSHSTRGRLQYSGAPVITRTASVPKLAFDDVLRLVRSPGLSWRSFVEHARWWSWLCGRSARAPSSQCAAAARLPPRKCLARHRSTDAAGASKVCRHAPCSEGLFFWPRLHALRPHCGRGPKSSRHCTRRLQHQTRGRGGEESY